MIETNKLCLDKHTLTYINIWKSNNNDYIIVSSLKGYLFIYDM